MVLIFDGPKGERRGMLWLIMGIAAAVLCLYLFLIAAGRRARKRGAAIPRVPYAHRGLYGGEIPENSLSAFKRAAEKGCGIELDVHATRDGVLVVHHDERVDRTTDGTGRVCDLSFDQLRRLNAAKLWDGKYGPEKVPAFEEYCEWAAGQEIVTNIEIKTDNTYYPDIEQKTWDLIVKYGLEKKVNCVFAGSRSRNNISKSGSPEDFQNCEPIYFQCRRIIVIQSQQTELDLYEI